MENPVYLPSNTNDNTPFYATIGVATSANYGRLWPFYRNNYSSDTLGPMAPEMGAFGIHVCAGNKDCVPCGPLNVCVPPPSNFGRYPVLMPSFTLKEAYSIGKPLPGSVGSQAPSAFVDDVHAGPNPEKSDIYVYVIRNFGVHGINCPDDKFCPYSKAGLTVSRAKLNGGR